MKVDLKSSPGVQQKLNLGLATSQPVASLVRHVPPLSAGSSIPHAIETLRQSNLDLYPVVSGARLIMLLSEADLSNALLYLPEDEREQYRLMSVSTILHSIADKGYSAPTLIAYESVGAAFRIFQEFPDISSIGVLDSNGGYFGVLNRVDLLAGYFRTLAPSRVGGMATPLGVYLTDGIDYGGVGNFALMLAGASMMGMFLVALVGMNLLDQLALAHHIDVWDSLIRILAPVIPSSPSVVMDLRSVAPVLIMMFIRFFPIAGYHAAEHQVVHCIERGEPLVPEIVAAMPRPHPRCGTNLVAASLIFIISMSVLGGMLQAPSGALIPAAVFTLLTWRQVGGFLQQYFTTRKASLKQLRSGIAAGEELLRKYRLDTNRRIKLPLRIWRMGFLQMFAGFACLAAVLWVLCRFIPQLQPYLDGLYY
jgi:CBS domain-containing protein